MECFFTLKRAKQHAFRRQENRKLILSLGVIFCHTTNVLSFQTRFARKYELINNIVMNPSSPNKRQVSGMKMFYQRLQNHDLPPPWHESPSFTSSYIPFHILSPLKRRKMHSIPVRSVDQLHHVVLDQNQELRNVHIKNYSQNILRNHDVLDIISQRFNSFSA